MCHLNFEFTPISYFIANAQPLPGSVAETCSAHILNHFNPYSSNWNHQCSLYQGH